MARSRPAMLVSCLLAVVVVAAGCGEEKTTHLEVRGLSGTLWKLLSSSASTSPDGVASVLVKYESKESLDDEVAVRREVTALWDDCRHKLAKQRVVRAVILAVSPIKPGWEMERDEARFVLRASPDGDTWTFVSDEIAEPSS